MLCVSKSSLFSDFMDIATECLSSGLSDSDIRLCSVDLFISEINSSGNCVFRVRVVCQSVLTGEYKSFINSFSDLIERNDIHGIRIMCLDIVDGLKVLFS